MMNGSNKAAEALNQYISELIAQYQKLIQILKLESSDIKNNDESKLSLHVKMELEISKLIISLTKTIRIYLKHDSIDDSVAAMLKTVEKLKKQASDASRDNIKAAESIRTDIKLKLSLIKLPQSPHRVYYSGNNPTLMDIKI